MGGISTVFNWGSPWQPWQQANAYCQWCARRHHSLGLDSVGMSYSYLLITIDYLSMLGLKLIIISKRGPRWTKHESVLWNGGVWNPLRKHSTNKAKPKRRITMVSMVSCQKGPTRHAYAWQIGPFWQDTLDIWDILHELLRIYNAGIKHWCWHVAPRLLEIFLAVADLVGRLCKRYVTSYWISRDENHRACKPTQDARFQSVIIAK